MVELRPPQQVMTLSRLGSLHQCRLSFMRQLTRRMAAERWSFTRTEFNIDAKGVGHAVYTAQAPERAYSLISFAHDLPDDQRSDRVIAEAWDATFALFDGIPSKEDIARLSRNVPLQEAGRITERELSLSRANRSVRLWAHVLERLSNGQQPDTEEVDKVGYLMRTTAVYGSGKFGAADRELIADRIEMQAPFQAEMLSVYLTRWFVRDLIEHMAKMRGGKSAAKLSPVIAGRLGIGNSTGLGMAPYIINHPVLFNNWIKAREQALAVVRELTTANSDEVETFQGVLKQAEYSVELWRSEHPVQLAKLTALKSDIEKLKAFVERFDFATQQPWDALMRWAEGVLGLEGQELLASLLLEPYGDLVDHLGQDMSDPEPGTRTIDGSKPIGQIRALIEECFGWALSLDWNARENCARAWYVSEEKLEPRLGERFEEPIAAYEQPLAPARDAAAAYAAMTDWDADTPIGDFLSEHPGHRHTIRRALISASAPYAEIRSNTIAADLLPIDMLRAKLSFFGVTHFDPRSDRWVRVCMYAGAPYPPELQPQNADMWVYPEVLA